MRSFAPFALALGIALGALIARSEGHGALESPWYLLGGGVLGLVVSKVLREGTSFRNWT